MEFLIVLGALVGIGVWIYVAYCFSEAAAWKGHHEKRYFWLTFFLGIIGMLLVIALPQPMPVQKQNVDTLPKL